MYQGQYDSGAEFAEMIASDCGYVSRDMPSWIEIDWQKTWDNALSYDYTQIGARADNMLSLMTIIITGTLHNPLHFYVTLKPGRVL